jgi:hypothetical protein
MAHATIAVLRPIMFAELVVSSIGADIVTSSRLRCPSNPIDHSAKNANEQPSTMTNRLKSNGLACPENIPVAPTA